MEPVQVAFSVAAIGRSSIKGRVAVLQLEAVGGPGTPGNRLASIRAPIGKSDQGDAVVLAPGRYVARLKLPTGQQITELVNIEADRDRQKVVLGKPALRPASPRTRGPTVEPIAAARRVPGPPVIEDVESIDIASPGTVAIVGISDQAAPFRVTSPVPRTGAITTGGDGSVAAVDTFGTTSFPGLATRKGNEKSMPAPAPRHFEVLAGSLGQISLRMEDEQFPVARYFDPAWRNTHPGRSNFELFGCAGSAEKLLQDFGRAPDGRIESMRLVDGLGLHFRQLPIRTVRSSGTGVRFEIQAEDERPLKSSAYAVFSSNIGNRQRGEPTGTWLMRLPGPWRRVGGLRSAHIHLDIRKKSAARPAISIVIDDPEIQSVIDFLQQKDLNAALAVLESSVDILMHKMENPYAAAAAGYVLMHAPEQKMPGDWHDWIGNLGNLFDDLPDGLILHATLLLQRPLDSRRSDPDYFPRQTHARIALAAKLILQALRRGLPLYRSGFSHLAANLNILDGRPELDEITQHAITQSTRMIHAMRLRLDPTQAFSVIDIPAS